MSRDESSCIYDKNHLVPIYDKRGGVMDESQRNLNISIKTFCEALQIKVRDVGEFAFNYTEKIDLGDFEVMKLNQNLDINFNEFKVDLIEMLQQNQRKEMFLKCEITDQKCTLVFYGKSKIKSIVYLTVDLKITNQREIFNEMNNSLQKIQTTNERLKRQLSHTQNAVIEKDQEIQRLTSLKTQLKNQFYNNLKQLESSFGNKVKEIESTIISKMVAVNQRVLRLLGEIETLKKETHLKSDSSARLVRSMESLRMETIENATIINDLKKENSALHALKYSQEKSMQELNKNLQEKDKINIDLQRKNEELRQDMEKTTIIIAQKKVTHDELARDLLQANQMLVNYNKHYDLKVKLVDELEKALSSKDEILQEQRIRTNDLLREFEEYKNSFNTETEMRYKHELVMANDKIHELELSLRKANKLNALLTDKVRS